MQTLAHDHYVKVPVIESVDKTNMLQIERAIKYLAKFKGKKLGFLGLSFKAGTEDLRNSPTVTLIESLLGKGFEIKIFDRNVHLSRLTGTNKEYIDEKIPHLTKLLVSDMKELTDSSDVLVITNNEKEFEIPLKDISDKTIVDFVRVPDELLRNKQNYYGINW